MKRVGAYVGVVFLGAVTGIVSALFMAGLLPGIAQTRLGGTVDVEGWRSDYDVGSRAADPYTRARIARHGLLALARTEAVYFTRTKDDDGAPLREACSYRVSGGTMPAQWWSLTLYDARSRLPANSDDALSIDASRVSGAQWEAQVAPRRPANGNSWISSRNADRFDLMLRLYVPDAAVLETPDATLSPPAITRLDCEGDG